MPSGTSLSSSKATRHSSPEIWCHRGLLCRLAKLPITRHRRSDHKFNIHLSTDSHLFKYNETLTNSVCIIDPSRFNYLTCSFRKRAFSSKSISDTDPSISQQPVYVISAPEYISNINCIFRRKKSRKDTQVKLFCRLDSIWLYNL
jgi:hypothetical protein